MTTEKQEVKLKVALMDFIKKEIVIQENPLLPPEVGEVAVSDRQHELVGLLYGLFGEFDKYIYPPKVDNPEKL